MTSKERAQLRAKANPLEPIIQIGKEGVTDNLITQIDDTLDTRELIKIRVHLETAPDAPRKFADELADTLGADVIQVIGGVIVLYRKADPERIAEKRKNAAREQQKQRQRKRLKSKGFANASAKRKRKILMQNMTVRAIKTTATKSKAEQNNLL